MTACRYSRTLGHRTLAGRHEDTCPGNCDGCQPCTKTHCLVCNRGHCDDTHPQTCPECVGLVREHLTAIVDMTDRLEDEATHCHADGRLNTGPLGGDAMVMLAEGRYLSAARLTADELTTDPTPPLLILADIEDQWRIELGHGGGPRATIWRAADYLTQHLTMMAQRYCAFDENATQITRLRGRMEAVLREGEREDQADVSCFECGGRLVRRVTDRGADDHWTCGRCRRRYTDPEYHLAVRAKLEAIRDSA